MKILLLGKNGMLGSAFLSHFAGMKGMQTFALSREEVDICDTEKLKEIIAGIKPDFLINCTAYTAVDNAETDQELAMKVNGFCLREIASVCRENGIKLIHFSTDYVFDGESMREWDENSETGPLNVYGESKLLGEELIQENCKDYFIVRTSWLFGPKGKNFVDTMLKLAETNKELKIVNDQFGSPTYTYDLVKAVIENFIEMDSKPGIYHLTNEGTVSWYQFALKIFELAGVKVDVIGIPSEEFPRPAKRPKYSTLKNTKTKPLRNFEVALESYIQLK